MWPNRQFYAELLTFTEKILNVFKRLFLFFLFFLFVCFFLFLFLNNLFYFLVGEVTFGKNCRPSNLFYVYCKDVNRKQLRKNLFFLLLHNSSTVIFTVEEFCQHRKKKKSARDCWIILPMTVEESCQWLLKNYASDCWKIVPATVDQSC